MTDRALKRDVAASTQNQACLRRKAERRGRQAFNAIAFFYKDELDTPLHDVDALPAIRPVHLRHVPTVSETRGLLQAVSDFAGYPTHLIAHLIYGCGLRVTEPLNLRIKDLNLERAVLFILSAKGGKDRVVSLPRSLAAELAQQVEFARAVWNRDKQNGIPVEIPHQLASKYPEYQFPWPWAWLFPAHYPCRHPRTGQVVRYQMHEVNVQRAIKIARRQLGIMVLPHELRHASATHRLERGANPRAIQQAMGHKSLETTMGYLPAESLSVPSPLETVLS